MPTQETTGRWASETKNMHKYNTNWGVVYVPKDVAEAAGGGEVPTEIKITLEAK